MPSAGRRRPVLRGHMIALVTEREEQTIVDDRKSDPRRPGPLGRLAGLAFRRRGRVLLAWAVALAAAIGLTAAFGGDFEADLAIPGSDSEQAQHLLDDKFPAQAGDPVDVVVRAGDVADPAVRDDVTALLAELSGLPHVAAVEDPYTTPGAISPDGRTLVARMNLDVANAHDMPIEDTERLLAAAEAAEAAEHPGLDIALGGESIRTAELDE